MHFFFPSQKGEPYSRLYSQYNFYFIFYNQYITTLIHIIHKADDDEFIYLNFPLFVMVPDFFFFSTFRFSYGAFFF